MDGCRSEGLAFWRTVIIVGLLGGLPVLTPSAHAQGKGTRPDDVALTSKPKPITVCSDAGAGAYEAFADVCRTDSGELLCVFYAGYAHVSHPNEKLPRGARIALCRSMDDGRTWSPAETVVDTPLDDRDPSILELPNGELLVTFMNYDPKRKSGTHQAFSVRSSDGGKTWSRPRPIATPLRNSKPLARHPG